MGNFGIATEALATTETVERQQRHLQLVDTVASIIVAAEHQPDYFNDLSGDEQIPCGD